jgi:transcription elongation factor GreB
VSNYITPEGAERLRAEQGELERQRPALIERIATLVQAGRRDEKEHRDDQRRLHDLDERVGWLRERIAGLEVVDPRRHLGGRVRFGARVALRDAEGTEATYHIVGVDEADASRGRISWISPLAKALLGATVGDEVLVRLPRGDRTLEVLSVDYA